MITVTNMLVLSILFSLVSTTVIRRHILHKQHYKRFSLHHLEMHLGRKCTLLTLFVCVLEKYEAEYIDKFANPFPASARGKG